MNRCASQIEQETQLGLPPPYTLEVMGAPWARVVNCEARRLHQARESYKARSEGLVTACRDPSKIFREVREDVLAAVRKCFAAKRGISVMKIGSDRRGQLRQTVSARKPTLFAKTRSIIAVKRLFETAQQHDGAACSWEKMAANLATTSDTVSSWALGQKSQGLGRSWALGQKSQGLGRYKMGAVGA